VVDEDFADAPRDFEPRHVGAEGPAKVSHLPRLVDARALIQLLLELAPGPVIEVRARTVAGEVVDGRPNAMKPV
jgi:hypothetical protein